MFIEFFSFKHNPFRARAAAGDVFVGPQQANVISSMTRALAATDAVVTVTGPVGVGKTTIVSRALDAVSSNRVIARIGRMRLNRDEVLELLLTELDAGRQYSSTVQRFGAFNRLLNDWSANDTRVFIVVEDAVQIGIDVLAELESLTASDAGDTPGANIILMGQPGLQDFLKAPALARLRQRVRLRQTIAPFSAAEIRGYLARRLRQAGAELETLCDAASVEVIHRCSEGIPRLVNNLCEAALDAAAEAKVSTLSPTLIAKIARDQFGYEGSAPSAPSPPAENAETVAEPAEPARTAAAQNDFDIPELIQDTMPELKALKVPGPDPAPKYSDKLMSPATPAQEMVALRDKTDNTEPALPVLKIPGASDSSAVDAAALAAERQRRILEPRAPEPLSKDSDPADTQTIRALDSALRPDTQLLRTLEEPTPVLEDDAAVPLGLQGVMGESPPADPAAAPGAPSRVQTEKLPTLSDSMRLDAPPSPAAPSADGPKKPDIDKLEAALAVARKGPIDLDPERAAVAAGATARPTSAAQDASPGPAVVPEITLDDSLQQAQQAAQAKLTEEAAKRAAQQAEEAATTAPPTPGDGADFDGLSTITEQLSAGGLHASPGPDVDDDADRQKFEQLAAELGSATSLEDIDDTAAETLFGAEFSQIAAQVAALAANDVQAETEPVAELQLESEPQPVAPPAAAPEPPSPEASATKTADAAQSSAPPKTVFGKPDIDSSAARRLEMVRSLNKNKGPVPSAPGPVEIVLGEDRPMSGPKRGVDPEPIENQFGTSMTATLKALSTQSIKAMQSEEEEEEEQKKGGLLSRFRRS